MAKQTYKIAIILALIISIMSPAFVSAAPSAGIKPGSFFYFFDTTFEKVGLFFTFSPEKKAQKALEYASERLAEVQAIEEEKNPDAIKTAITNYERNVALATEKSKEVKDKGQAENLLNLIADNTSKNQEVLSAVLIKVPEEAKEAIMRAIEMSRKNQEEAVRQVAELKKEIAGLKQEIEDLEEKLKDKEMDAGDNGSNKTEQKKAIENLKDEIKSLKKEVGEPVQQEIKSEVKKEETGNNIVNLPNGAIVEMDAGGNVVKTIKEAPEQTNIAPTPIESTTQTQTSTTIQILPVNVTPSLSSAQIEWQTNIPTNSKIFLSGGSLSSKVYSSESGLSTRHIVNATGLTSGTTYSYEIESIAGEQVAKKQDSFATKPDEYTISVQPDKTSVPASSWHNINFKISALKNGQYQAQQNVSVATPNSAQNRTISTNGISSTGANDWSGSFSYLPKTIGTHTIVFSWNGVNKNVDIQATEYVEQKPTAQLSSSPTSIECSQTNITVATVEITNLEENMTLDSVNPFSYNIISSDFTKAELEITPNISNNTLSKGGDGYIYFRIKKTPAKTGKFKLEITNTSIKLIGQQSGLYRTINNFSTITPEIEIYDQKLVEWYAYNYNQTIKGYSSPNQNENGLAIINRSQTIATVSSIEWEKQTTGNLQVQNILIYPSLPHNIENYNERNDLLVKITYSGTPQTGDKISIKPTITLSTGQKLECTGGNGCWLTWTQP